MVLVIKILSGSLKISMRRENMDLKFLCAKVPRGYSSAHAEYSKPPSHSAASSRGRESVAHTYIYIYNISLLLHV